MSLPSFSVKRPVTTLMLFLGLGMIGFYSTTMINVDMFPDISPPVISILTIWPGASASDIESEVTETIEDQVNSVNDLDTLNSKSLDNLSIVSCKFDWGSELDVATNDIRDRLEFAKKDLPKDAEPPVIFKFSSATAPIMFFSVTCNKSWPVLYHLGEKKISDALKRIPGVGAVMIYGGMRRRINVYFDKDKVESFNLSLPNINRILASENINIPAGNIKSGQKDYFVRIPARFNSMDEIKNTTIGYCKNRPVYLKDVASVEDDFETQMLNGWGDGKPALVMVLQKQSGKNTILVLEKVKKKLEQLQKELPSDIRIKIIMDNSENILNSVNNLKTNMFSGIFFVILVTALFLRRIRTVFIIVIMIPTSLIIAFIFLYMFDFTINLISLMALAIASGLVVDNGIVVLENITRHIEKGGRIKASAIFGANEMGLAITASTATTIVVFLPLMFVTGLAGIIFKQLGFVIVITLTSSLVTALMLTPMLISKWVVATPKELKNRGTALGRLYNRTETWFELLETKYQQLLKWALNHKLNVIFISIVIFLSSISLIPFISTGLFPVVDTGDLAVTFRLAEGTRLEKTNSVVDSILNSINEVVRPEELRASYAIDGESKQGFGAALGFERGTNVGRVSLKLVDRDMRTRSAKEIAAVLRDRVDRIPGITNMKVRAQSAITGALMGRGRAISLEIQGYDIDKNIKYARKLIKQMKSIEGLVDVGLSQKDLRPELWVEIDRKKAADLGLNVAMIAGTLRNYFYGKEATEYRDGGENFDIFTRFSEKDKNKLSNLANIPVFTPDGRMIKLGTVSRIVEGNGPIEIERKNRQRVIKVEGDLHQRSLGDVAADVKKILKKLGTPPGISVSFGGEVEEQKKAFIDLLTLLIMGIILVYMVMASLFENLRDPFIVMFSVPFAFTGVFYILYFTNTSIGIMVFMGIIMLMGIVVNNAIVLIDYIHLLQKRGRPLFEAVIEAGKNRLRPVLMTTFTTFFGMLPMAVSDSVGAEAWNPLGITMLGGLSVSTVITLILIPTIYYLFENRKLSKSKS